MIQNISSRLTEKGYVFLPGVPKEAGVFYRLDAEILYCIVLIDYHTGFSLTVEQAQRMHETLRKTMEDRFLNKEVDGRSTIKEVRELMLIVSAQPELIREICTQQTNTWVVDTEKKRLLLYENQPGDFDGLKDMLEALSETDVKEEQTESGNSSTILQQVKNRVQGRTITLFLVAVNVIVWVVLAFLGDTNSSSFMYAHGAMFPPAILLEHQWYRFITSMFLHFGPEHLLNNMVILILIGDKLEMAVGRVYYLGLYLLSGISGGALSYYIMMKSGDMAVSAGASGAIFGVIGGLLVIAIKNKGQFQGLSTGGLIFMITLILYFGFTSSGVDNWAHIGGMLCGILLTTLRCLWDFRNVAERKRN